MPEVSVTGLRKDFGSTAVLHNLNFTIADGEFFTLLGPSGCGKSTTLACLAGLEQPTAGKITVGGTTFFDGGKGIYLPPEQRELGMVFQSYALWPHMSIAQNLAMPLNIRRIARTKQKSLIEEALEKVGLAHLAQRYPHELSGGQQQRVALARALVYAPRVLLLDEPLSNLDAKLREQARIWLKKLQVETGITTVYVTHDQEEALAMSDRIAVMEAGNMVQVATPTEIYQRPATVGVAAFVGRSNFLRGRVLDISDGSTAVRLDSSTDVLLSDDVPPGLRQGDRVTVAFRPESASFVPGSAPTGGQISGRVTARSYVGARYEYHIAYGDDLVEVTSPSGDIDGNVTVTVPSGSVRLYTETGERDPEVKELIQGIV